MMKNCLPHGRTQKLMQHSYKGWLHILECVTHFT